MAQKLDIVSSTKEQKTGVENTPGIAVGLRDCLADTYRLMFKTHAYHWNVEGPLFYALHNLTETQYEDLFAASDVIAERIRAIGELAPYKLSEVMEHSVIEDGDDKIPAVKMAKDLAEDHQRMAHRLHALTRLADKNNDIVTADLATQRSTFHEKAAWMLRAIAA